MSEPLTVEQRSLGDLTPFAHNARTHSEAQIEQIAASIKEFGFNDPIAVDEDGVIIEGHGRVLAARELGIDLVPVITLSGLSEAQKRAYRLAHNKLVLNSDWDSEILTIELGWLLGSGIDVGFTGFSEEEVEALLGDTAKIKEVAETLKPKHFMRVLVSVPVDSAVHAKEILEQLATVPGIEIDYGAN